MVGVTRPTSLVVLVPGVHEGEADATAWTTRMSLYLRDVLPGVFVVAYTPGWTSGASIGLPLWGWISRRVKVRRFQRWLARVVSIFPDVPVDVYAHSWGSLLARESLRRGPQEARPRFRTLILAGSIVDQDDRFACGRVQRVACLYSKDDVVVRRVPGFGEAGNVGLSHADGVRLLNVDLTPLGHGDYTRPGRAWSVVAELLARPT